MAKCECCDEDTLTEGDGNFEICHCCNWEDDPVQNADPWLAGGANFFCLLEHRALYHLIRRVTEYRDWRKL